MSQPIHHTTPLANQPGPVLAQGNLAGFKSVVTMALLLAGLYLAFTHTLKADAAEPAKAEPAVNPPTAAPSPSAATYVVKKGDTLSKLIQHQYKGSPLKPEVLQGAVLAANPQLGKGKTVQLRWGTQLILPEHSHIVLTTLVPYISQEDLASLAPPPAPVVDATPRRDWIRYP